MAIASEFEPVPPGWEQIAPQEKMGNNQLCWCKSGKKWKKCHRDRELLPQVTSFELMEIHTEEFARGYCSHPKASEDTCHPKIIQSHSIQRKKVLDSIAETGHVFSSAVPAHKLFNSNKKYGLNLELKKIGIGKASTFPGFCAKHDSDLFQRIENGSLSFEKDTAYIFSLRAMALEVFKKKAAIRALDEQRELADRGLPFIRQVEIQALFWASQSGQKAAIRDMNHWLERL